MNDSAPEGVAEELEVEIDEVEAKVAELTDDLRRVHAEYANYRKRVDRDREAARISIIGMTLAELLPVLDDIDRAREHGELTGAFKAVSENLEQIVEKYNEINGGPFLTEILKKQLH